MTKFSKIAAAAVFAMFVFQTANAATISFAGLEWTVRDTGYGAPGKNHWRSDNVWVDELGRLHLAIRRVGGKWTCAELQSKQKFRYGKYSFDVVGRLDQLDPNVVLGLFQYPTEASKNGLGEIDVEFARWGNPTNAAGNFSVWSDLVSNSYATRPFEFAMTGTYSRHIFTRTSKTVSFQSFHGHAERNEMARWSYRNADVSKTPMPIYLNFWLFRGYAPVNGMNAEIVISDVKFAS